MSAILAADPCRRARPLLGTIVEISAEADGADDSVNAVNAAFAAIGEVQRLMSYHDPFSELSRLNAIGARGAVPVSDWTFEVIAFAQALAEETGGAFDVTVAPRLASWGFLPRTPPHRHEERRATFRDIRLLPRRKAVEFRRPLHIDLGGIAKGFAVDRAVESLRARGIASGCVNAGGDLRVFGEESQRVGIRHPARPSEIAWEVPLRNAAMATSGAYFAQKIWRGETVCPLIDGRTRRCSGLGVSASVVARTAMVADALTKVVLALRHDAAPILARYAAGAFLLGDDGACSISGDAA
jgi:FAD:protein FMN transferase